LLNSYPEIYEIYESHWLHKMFDFMAQE